MCRLTSSMLSSMAKTRFGFGVNTAKLPQQQVAEKAGISVPYLSQIESGRRKGSTAVLAALARVLGVTLDDLVDEQIPRENNP